MAAAVAAALVGARTLPVREPVSAALAWIEALGPWGEALFVLLYVVCCVLLIPGAFLTLGAGAAFGLGRGTLLVAVGATLGATAAFLVGRHLARAWVVRWVEAHPRFSALDDAVAREGWKIVGLCRLSPVFPFVLLNYAFGLTRVSLAAFVVATAVGMLPATLLYVYVGSLAGSLATLDATGRERTAAEWAFYAVGFAATVGVTAYVTRLARAALAGRVGP